MMKSIRIGRQDRFNELSGTNNNYVIHTTQNQCVRLRILPFDVWSNALDDS